MLARTSIDYTRSSVISEDETKSSSQAQIDCKILQIYPSLGEVTINWNKDQWRNVVYKPDQWDYFKVSLRSFIQNYSNKRHAQMKSKFSLLQRKHRQLLRWNTSIDVSSALHHIESQIDQLSENSADILALHSGIRGQFYDKLHTPGPIDPNAVTTLLNSFPEPTSYDPETNADLLSRWSADDISSCLQFAPHNSSPGIAGLPFETLQLLFQHSFCRRLFTRATNIALPPRTNIKLPPCWSFNLQTFIACSILNLWRLR
ncbi:hypothetical protein G6F61_007578 [Rhizopus arrhizus]|nr:hypothetical protein G6F61_007578 [Rhizopus arrhizus]